MAAPGVAPRSAPAVSTSDMEKVTLCDLFADPDHKQGLVVQLMYKSRDKGGVPFILLPGAVICSADIASVLKGEGQIVNWQHSSLGAVGQQMLHDGVDLTQQVPEAMRRESQGHTDKPVMFRLWKRSDTTQEQIKCSSIWAIGMPASWNQAEDAGAEADLQGLQMLYQMIREQVGAMTRDPASQGAITMPTIGKCKRFELRYAIQEIVALAVHCRSCAATVRALNISTFTEASKQEYIEHFSSEEWQSALHPEQHIGRHIGQLQKLVPGCRAQLPRVAEQLEELASVWEAWKRCQGEWKTDAAAKAALVEPLQRVLVFMCCSKARLAVEHVATALWDEHAEACKAALEASADARRKAGAAHPTLDSKLWALKQLAAAGQQPGLQARFCKDVSQDCCYVLKNTGNKALHDTVQGRVTMVDAFVVMFSMVKLVAGWAGWCAEGCCWGK